MSCPDKLQLLTEWLDNFSQNNLSHPEGAPTRGSRPVGAAVESRSKFGSNRLLLLAVFNVFLGFCGSACQQINVGARGGLTEPVVVSEDHRDPSLRAS